MPRDANGNYTLPAGNPVVSGTTITSVWANTTMPDIQQALTDSLSRTGQGGMLVPFRLPDGSVSEPALAFTTEITLGVYRVGTGVMGFAASGALQATVSDQLTGEKDVLTEAKLKGYRVNGTHVSYSGDLNDIAVNSNYQILGSDVSNLPPDYDPTTRSFITTDVRENDDTSRTQLIIGLDGASAGVSWIRTLVAGVWGDWAGFGSGGGGGTEISPTPPENPVPNQTWWDSELGRAFVYYDDGDSQQWVEEDPPTAGGDVQPLEIFVNGTPVAAAGQSNIEYAISAGVKQVKVSWQGLKKDSTAFMGVRLGDSGGVKTTGYNAIDAQTDSGGPAVNAFVNGFTTGSLSAAHRVNGSFILTLLDEATNTWACTGVLNTTNSTPTVCFPTGTISLDSPLTTISVYTSAGTFDEGVVNVQYDNPSQFASIVPAGTVVQVVQAEPNVLLGGSGNIPADDTVPQSNEGDAVPEFNINFTPKFATSKILVEFRATCGSSSAGALVMATMFRDAETDAFLAAEASITSAGQIYNMIADTTLPALSTAPIAFTVRAGCNAGAVDWFINGSIARFLGGAVKSVLKITEIAQ